jgi:hypothetical protein
MEQQTNNYFDLVLSMFNQYLFQDSKNNIDDITIYYRTNPATSGNPLIEELLKAIKDYSLENIGYPLFNSILAKTGKSAAESQEIINKVVKYKNYNKEQIKPAKEYLRNIIASVYLQKASRLYGDNPAELINYVKALEFKSADTDYLNSTSFNKVDINTVIADSNSATLTSSFKFINESFSEGAFKPGDIIVYSAGPSNGKSLFAEQEALHMAIDLRENVNMLIMGDLSMDALILRLATIYSGLTFKEARTNLANIYAAMCRDIGDRLDVIIAPAGVIKAEDYVQYILNSKKKYKACFIDYDENFAMSSRENMYNDFGALYDEFTKLKEAGIISYVLCQPKAYTWNSGDLVRLEDLGTSSRKGHIADVVITRSKEKDTVNGLGIFNIAKNRHGGMEIAHSIRLDNGRFKVIPKVVYDNIKQLTEHQYFTEGELDMMIRQYEIQKSHINLQVAQKIQTQQGGTKTVTGPNPFE